MSDFNMAKELTRPESYPEGVSSVDLVQTHISWVFLTGEFCYKVKKPVDFGFLDFSSLEKRKFYCNEELRVNRRLCPDIYLDVVPITKRGGGLAVGEKGEVVDYAVKMLQLPREKRMDLLLEDGGVGRETIDDIAKSLAEFHRDAMTGEGIDRYGSLETIKANWDQNFEQSRNLRGSLVPEEVFDFIEGRVNEFMLNNMRTFEKRVKEGRVRECHGDVHSGNIFVDDKTYIFDAIEFNPAFSCSDTAAEVAFLAMDLDFKGKEKFSKSFIREYVGLSKDGGIPALLDFYKCYRAYVRAKVTGFRLFEPGMGGDEKERVEGECREYFDLAHSYARNL